MEKTKYEKSSELPPEVYAHFILGDKGDADFEREWSKLCKWIRDGDAVSVAVGGTAEKREVFLINPKLVDKLSGEKP